MLPKYIVQAYNDVPADRAVSVLIRHSIRYPINSVDEIWTAGLTPEGEELARRLGAWLDQDYSVGRIESSPIDRCVATGNCIASALTEPVAVATVDVLRHPNENGEYDAFGESLLAKEWPKRIQDQATHLIPNGNHHAGLNIFISHDTTLVAMVGYWLNKDVRDLSIWPNFLEPFFLWWEEDGLVCSFRGEREKKLVARSS